jgi:excisionase family DNA binding protein
MAILLDYDQTAQELSLSVATLRRLVNDGKLSPVRIGGNVRFRRTDLEAFADSLANGSVQTQKKRGRPRLAV